MVNNNGTTTTTTTTNDMAHTKQQTMIQMDQTEADFLEEQTFDLHDLETVTFDENFNQLLTLCSTTSNEKQQLCTEPLNYNNNDYNQTPLMEQLQPMTIDPIIVTPVITAKNPIINIQHDDFTKTNESPVFKSDHDYFLPPTSLVTPPPSANNEQAITPNTNNNTDSNNLKAKAKQRNRSVYRAEDIKTQQDLESYIERRKKNNESSKISRANKRSQYKSMDARSDALELDNKRQRVKIELMDEAIKAIKQLLYEQIHNVKPSWANLTTTRMRYQTK